MRPYEVLFILDSTLADDAIDAVVARARGVLDAGGATALRVDRWGKRRLAYEIAHKAEGYYVLLEATAEPANVAELDRMLHLADEVIRHKVIRLPEGVAGRARPAPVAVQAAPAEEQGANPT